MEYRKDKDRYLVKLEKGDRVPDSLASFANEEKIDGAYVTAIGAFDTARLAFFDDEKEEYVYEDFSGGLEVIGLQGNLSRLADGAPMVHLHAALGRSDYSVVGGHLAEGVVSVTLEVLVLPTNRIDRRVPFGPFKLWKLT